MVQREIPDPQLAASRWALFRWHRMAAEVFSEAMPDLDLVVSVSTVASDPVWMQAYHGQPVLVQYWEAI